MALFDLPLAQLQKYRAPNTEPADFDRFWKQTLADSAKFPLDARFERVKDSIYNLIDVFDVTFNGFMGQPIKGWFLKPAGQKAPLPCMVQFIGYGGGRGFPTDFLAPVMAGFALFAMDTRGQGSAWGTGDTPDEGVAGPQYPGFMTRGIGSRETYYYRRVFTDAARAVEAAASNPSVDPKRIGVMGGSQGGGITLAAAALAGKKVKLAWADVPFLCHYDRAIVITDSHPYNEIVRYLAVHRGQKEAVLKTLSYFDGVNFAKRISARCLFSVGLMDVTCPPSTVYAAYNNVKTPKEIRIYDFNSHEGGGAFQVTAGLRYAVKHL